MVLPAMPDGIRLPEANTPELVEKLDTMLTEYEEELGLEIGHFKILPSIETAEGVINCIKTAKSSSRLIGLAFGAEDYTASLEIERTKGGEELFAARTRVVWACKAAGIQAIDTIFPDASDMDALRTETQLIKTLGFSGKSLVNPRQIDVIHEVLHRNRMKSTTLLKSLMRSNVPVKWERALFHCMEKWWMHQLSSVR